MSDKNITMKYLENSSTGEKFIDGKCRHCSHNQYIVCEIRRSIDNINSLYLNSDKDINLNIEILNNYGSEPKTLKTNDTKIKILSCAYFRADN